MVYIRVCIHICMYVCKFAYKFLLYLKFPYLNLYRFANEPQLCVNCQLALCRLNEIRKRVERYIYSYIPYIKYTYTRTYEIVGWFFELFVV